MNRFCFVNIFLFVNSVLVISAFAQAPASPKIAFIDPAAFSNEKTGITKYVNAYKQLDNEFAAQIKAQKDGNAKLEAIAKELGDMLKLPANQYDDAAYQKKRADHGQLEIDQISKGKALETAIDKRRKALFDPINQDVWKAIDDYAKKNGYGVILDFGKLAEAGAVLYFAPAADATADFIAFYNARP